MRRGVVYVVQGEPGPMAGASAGVRVDTPGDGPPWIVVERDAASLMPTRWGGRLWKVRIVRKAHDQPLAGAGYARATAVEVEEELPLSALFPHRGVEVAAFLSSITALSLPSKERLAGLDDEEAARIHGEVWKRWPVPRGARSPLGSAPWVVHAELAWRARELEGEAAFDTDDDERSLNEGWLKVARHLQHALCAIGAPDAVVKASERAVLTRAYRLAMSGEPP